MTLDQSILNFTREKKMLREKLDFLLNKFLKNTSLREGTILHKKDIVCCSDWKKKNLLKTFKKIKKKIDKKNNKHNY